jgi:hypothetical protein
MNETEMFKSIWIGTEFISIGDVKQKGNELMFKKVGAIPFMNSFVPVLANAEKIPYQERKLWTPNIGDTGQKIRVYMSDLRLDKYYALTNPQDLTAIAHLKTENLALKNHLEQLYNMLHDVSSEDRITKRIKKMREQYNAIMGYGSGGSYGSFGSPAGGGFGGMPPSEGVPDFGGSGDGNSPF